LKEKSNEIACLYQIIEQTLFILWKHLNFYLTDDSTDKELQHLKRNAIQIFLGSPKSTLATVELLEPPATGSSKFIYYLVGNIKKQLS